MKAQSILSWILQIVSAFILLQTLYFKFTGHAESVYIFTTVGMEPWGRIGSGIMELVAGVLLLMPRTVVYGAGIAIAVMAGAIASHLFILGIEVMGDGGQLFYMGCIVMLSSIGILWIHRKDVAVLSHKVRARLPI